MSFVRSSFIVSIFTSISRLSGFIRDIFISSYLGAGILSDIFNIAFRLPNFFRRIFAEGAFNSAFIPIYNNKIGDESSNIFINQTFTILFFTVSIFVIIIEIFLPLFMYILAPGFNNGSDEWNLAIELCHISMPYLLFVTIVSFCSSILNSHHKYGYASSIPILLNISIISSLFLFKNHTKTYAHALIWGVLISGIIQLAVMIYVIYKNNIKIKFVRPKLDNDISTLFKNMIPGILSGGVMQINILFDQALASFLAPGAISYLSYAERINQLPLAIIGIAIGTVLLPVLSNKIKLNKIEESIFIQNRALEAAILFALPASLAIITMSDDIISILFERGRFTRQDTINTAKALSIFTIGLPAYIMSKILIPSFFANFNTKTPLYISIICLLSNIFISILLMKKLSFLAIATATSISAWLNFSIMFFCLNRNRLIKLDNRIKINIIKIIISCLVMILSLKFIDYNLARYSNPVNNIIMYFALIIKIFAGIITFLISIYYFKIYKISDLYEIFRK